jgi:hypothetical protein
MIEWQIMPVLFVDEHAVGYKELKAFFIGVAVWNASVNPVMVKKRWHYVGY